VENFYESRYIKIAQTMQDIDAIAETLTDTFGDLPPFLGIEQCFAELAESAKVKTETLRTDKGIFEVWATYVASAERLAAFEPMLAADASARAHQEVADALQLIRAGADLISHITRARVTMPKSKREFIERCERFRSGCEAIAPRAEAGT
jgi:hypothetical protein